MLNRRSLDPEQRTLYGANLQPPAGYVFDAAVATTFSLDFETALAVPVSLALFAAENRDDILSHPLALLEGAERIAGRLARLHGRRPYPGERPAAIPPLFTARTHRRRGRRASRRGLSPQDVGAALHAASARRSAPACACSSSREI